MAHLHKPLALDNQYTALGRLHFQDTLPLQVLEKLVVR
jgi:hypothetical protein